jgi:flagellar basal-body rod protein FlgB
MLNMMYYHFWKVGLPMLSLNQSNFSLLERSLDASALRQRVIANNVANVDTPNFKKSEVRFEEYLNKEMQPQITFDANRTDARHFEFESLKKTFPEVIMDERTAMNNNMNNVDIDSEMSLMAKNQLRYNTTIQQVNHDLKQLRTAINGGK